jgi:epoxyqueuosine reductase
MGTDFEKLKTEIARLARELGFQDLRVADTDLAVAGERLSAWLAGGHHGSMEFMQRHGTKRSVPAELVPGTIRIVSVRMNYLPEPQESARTLLDHDSRAYVSRYALGRDYHKLMRRRLQKLADAIEERTGPFGYRVFVDSAPVLEKPLAEKAGIGWLGKHTNVINKSAGSWFFLGELYTDLPLPVDETAQDHCGTCTACIDVCPTDAIIAPYTLDARRCISYLTIENKGPIPEEFREAIGNRVYGCDDCQLFCPWNKFASLTAEDDFLPRHNLDSAKLTELFSWSEDDWLEKTRGSAIRRIGFDSWLRNIAVALGNAETGEDVITALQNRRDSSPDLVREHIEWALARHENKTAQGEA